MAADRPRRIVRTAPDYPGRLLDLPRPPEPLWVSGELPPATLPTVGIVGTRRCTPYGVRAARQLAGALAAAGAVIVSGLAQGIDSTAHAAALDVEGRTVAILGEGLTAFERSGPMARRRLAAAIRRSGAVISEYAPDQPARDWTFPRRNATIAALSDAVLLVEAPEGSGALITVDDARGLGRPVFAVPGPVGSPTWSGSHRCIAEGVATILTRVDDVAAAVGLAVASRGELTRPTTDPLLELLCDGPADADAIGSSLGLDPAGVADLLATRLLDGAIYTTPDGRFARR